MSAPAIVTELRQRVAAMQASAMPLDFQAKTDKVVVRPGSVYAVEQASVALGLLAGASQKGAWCAIIGVKDLGYEYAAEMGVDLERLIVVPEPRHHWPEVTAALIDIVPFVLVRPAGHVNEAMAARLAARLRKRSAALVSWGAWPHSEARILMTDSCWEGVGHGEGHLVQRQARLAMQRGHAPAHALSWGAWELGVG